MSWGNFKNRNMDMSNSYQNNWKNRRMNTANRGKGEFLSHGKRKFVKKVGGEYSERRSEDDDASFETKAFVEKPTTSKQSRNSDRVRDNRFSDHSDNNDVYNDFDNDNEDNDCGGDESIDDNDGNDSGGDESIDDNDEEVGATSNKETEDEYAALKKELADVPLEDLMKIKEKLGLKVFNKIMHGDKFANKKQKIFKRANPNRPREISSKKWVPVLRNADVPKPKVTRDPRFDDLSGEYQEKHFDKNYSFLQDMRGKEKLLVQKKLKKAKDETRKKELTQLLNRMTQQEQTDKQKKQRSDLEKQLKEKEKQLVKEGKTPYFLKKSEKKKLELAEKFKDLQQTGKYDQYMNKKLKKNAKKEKKKLPGRHDRFT